MKFRGAPESIRDHVDIGSPALHHNRHGKLSLGNAKMPRCLLLRSSLGKMGKLDRRGLHVLVLQSKVKGLVLCIDAIHRGKRRVP